MVIKKSLSLFLASEASETLPNATLSVEDQSEIKEFEDMDRCASPTHCSNHTEEDWMYCVFCRTKVQAARSLKRAQSRSMSWPVKPVDQASPVKDLSSCTIDEAIGTMVQYLNISTRHCKKYYNGQSDSRRNCFDRNHCSRFHVDQSESARATRRNPLTKGGIEGMCISVDPGTYSITAGDWGGAQTQTHVVRLSSGAWKGNSYALDTAMEGLKMAHRSNQTVLPSIHRSDGVPKISEYGNMNMGSAQKQRNFVSAHSHDGGLVEQESNTEMNSQHSASLDALFPNGGDADHIDMGRIRIERRSHKQLLPPSIRNMTGSKRSKSGHSVAQSYVSATFDPLPFQPQYFKSSTVLKMVPVLRRHQDMFVDKTPVVPREKPLIIHSERYQYNDPLRPGFDRLGQRERLLAEREYTHRLKQQKQARETLPHRESRDLLMGGQRASFNERFDVRDELRRLKAIVLPVNARELYHGKGIQLPATHSSIKPRQRMPPPLPVASPEGEEELAKEAALYRHSKSSLDGLRTKQAGRKAKQTKSKIDTHQGRSLTFPIAPEPVHPSLSRRSTESNFMTLPEDIDMPPDMPKSPGLESEGDYIRTMSRDAIQPSAVPRAESEMDIIIPPDAESATPAKPAKSHTPIKAPTPNPLKAADLSLYQISEHEMKTVFQKLDTDDDGHLMYQQVEPQFPSTLILNQKKYLKRIYEITSASTYFGMKEFVTLTCLCEEVAKLDHQLMLNGYDILNFSTLTTIVIQYTELFQQVDRTSKGKITVDSLADIICSALQRDKEHIEYGLSELKNVLKIEGNDVNKVKFIAGIPYFLTIANLVKPTEGADSTDVEKTAASET